MARSNAPSESTWRASGWRCLESAHQLAATNPSMTRSQSRTLLPAVLLISTTAIRAATDPDDGGPVERGPAAGMRGDGG